MATNNRRTAAISARSAHRSEQPSSLLRKLFDRHDLAVGHNQLSESFMTVTLFAQRQDIHREVVIQTNCTTLDAFIRELAEAIEDGLSVAEKSTAAPGEEVPEPRDFIRSVLRNAFPVAFAISGYKAEAVTEAKLLTCGKVPPTGLPVVAMSTGATL